MIMLGDKCIHSTDDLPFIFAYTIARDFI